jgi:hypothetical protein
MSGPRQAAAKLPGAAWREWRWLLKWALAFVIGVLIVAYAPGAWRALGVLIVAPTIIAVMLFAWSYLLYHAVRLLGGDPTQDTCGIWIFLSFAFVVLPLLVAWLRHR